jgi:hypothetical protein
MPPAKREESYLRSFRQVAKVFARHGLGLLADVFGLRRSLPFHRR